MSALSRREFLQTTAAGAALSGVIANARLLRANPLGMPIGCQTYPIRMSIGQDPVAAFKQLADAGFQTIELCSPIGYKEFAALTKYKGAELKTMLGDLGLTCVSTHVSMREMRTGHEATAAWANEAGITQMMVASLGGPQQPTMDDVKKAADEYNAIAEKSAKAGIQQGLHNEGFEMSSVGDRRTYDILFELLDPKLVKFQFQVSTISRGFDAAEYFTKYPGRFISMHVQGWSSETKTQMAVGQDTLDWKKIFTAAKTGGIKNYFVEMNLELMKASVPYLKALTV
jgi:sugar phosphate isomerase/epimerase